MHLSAGLKICKITTLFLKHTLPLLFLKRMILLLNRTTDLNNWYDISYMHYADVLKPVYGERLMTIHIEAKKIRGGG